MGWRYYAKTAAAANGLWVDDNLQLTDVELTYELNSPFAGKAMIPYGQYGPHSNELLSYWKRYGTVLYAEEEEEINWGGLCVGANPGENGLMLEFTGSMGWMSGVPWGNDWQSWQVNGGTVISMLHAYSQGFGATGAVFPIDLVGGLTGTVGDAQPPPQPAKPPRPKGMKKSEYEDSPAYELWLIAMEDWHNNYDSRETYKIQWWNSPYIGGEIESVIKAIGANYRENYKWLDKEDRTVSNELEIADAIYNIRYDVKFEDGVNLAQKIDAKDNTRKFFHQALVLGTGESASTRLASAVAVDTDHFYQGYWGSFRDVWDQGSLQNLANYLVAVGHNSNPVIDNIVVWDIADPSNPKVSSLHVGDVVNVVSTKTLPHIDQWCRITKIVKKPKEVGLAQLTFEIVDV